MNFLCICIGAMLIAISASASASASGVITVEQYQTWSKGKDKEIRDMLDTYLHGFGNGLILANNELKSRRQPLFYCQPEHLALTSENYRHILNDEIGQLMANTPKNPIGPLSIEVILMGGLKKTFPCNK